MNEQIAFLVDSDSLPAYCQARVLVLGVGNLLFGDDGFGPGVIDHLIETYEIPDDIYVMDVGTGVRKLLFTLLLSENRVEEIVIVDAVDGGRGDGAVGILPLEALPETKVDDFSLHQVPTSNMLKELGDHRHNLRVTVIACDVGVVPQVIQPGLSPQTRLAAHTAGEQIASKFGLRRLVR